MFFKLISQQIREFQRGRNKTKDILARVVLLLFMLYFLVMAIGIGFYMKEVITIVFPDMNPVHIFYGIILYYFMFDFLLRIPLQELPTISIQPYLTLNIRKRAIVNFLNVHIGV